MPTLPQDFRILIGSRNESEVERVNEVEEEIPEGSRIRRRPFTYEILYTQDIRARERNINAIVNRSLRTEERVEEIIQDSPPLHEEGFIIPGSIYDWNVVPNTIELNTVNTPQMSESLCSFCGHIIEEEEKITVEGCLLCKKCLRSETYICDICGERFLTTKRRITIDNKSICKECCDDLKLRICVYCGRYFNPNNQSNREAVFCENCVLIAARCNNCGRAFLRSDSSDSTHNLCNRCYTSRFGLHSFDYKPRTVFHGSDESYHLGVELEIEIPEKYDRNGYTRKIASLLSKGEELFYIKHDGSITYGIEIVSHPCTLSFHKKEFPWKELLMNLKKDFCLSNNTNTCGLHIHISKNVLRPNDFYKLSMFIHNQIDNIEIIARRRGCAHAKFKSVIPLKGVFRDLNNERYEAINFINKNTIEYRMFKGTLSLNTLMASLEFVHSSSLFIGKEKTVLILKNNKQAWSNYLQYLHEKEDKYSILLSYLKDRGASF